MGSVDPRGSRAIELSLAPEPGAVGPSLDFVERYAEAHGVGAGVLPGLRRDLSRVLGRVVARNKGELRPAEVTLRLTPEAETLSLELVSRGRPLDRAELPDGVSFRNLGRGGQSVVFEIPAASGRDVGAEPAPVEGAAPELRELRAGEEGALSELFYRVYGYRYINEYVYFPEQLRARLEDGRLRSLVAVDPSGACVAHVGMVRLGERPPVYEAALGVVDPRHKSSGLFSRVFQEVMGLMERTPMSYAVYDFVTNHAFSQRLVAKYGYCDLALFLGSQVAETQARLSELGLGEDPKAMDRYSVLLGVGPRTGQPFGRDLQLPINLGEAFGFLLKPIGLAWAPTPRFSPLPEGGEFAVARQDEQRALIVDFPSPGRQALARLIADWRQAYREGMQYCAVDVPLDGPGVGQLSDLLAKEGFFPAGFVPYGPYRFGDRLGFRFQYLAPVQVDFGAIQLHTEGAKRLLEVVRRGYERRSLRP